MAVSVGPGPRGGRLEGLHQSGSLKLLFPRCAPGTRQAVLVNTAGGITGGDRFSVTARAAPGAHLCLTTQACERAYRAASQDRGQLDTRLEVGDGARLDWLPQETILFDGSALKRSLRADLSGSARLLLVEPLLFGRTEMGERLTDLRFSDRIEIRRAGRPVYLDALNLDGDADAHLGRAFTAGGARAMAGLVFAAPEAEALLPRVRALLPETGGASLLAPDLMCLRLLAADGFALRRVLMPVLTLLTGAALPRPWML